MQALKMEPVSFDVVISATTAISTMQLRCNTDCCARRKLLCARILCLVCFSSTVTLKLTSILCCFRQHPLHQTKVHHKLNWQWPVAPDQGVSKGVIIYHSFTRPAALNAQPPHILGKNCILASNFNWSTFSRGNVQFSIVTCFFGYYDTHTSCFQLPVWIKTIAPVMTLTHMQSPDILIRVNLVRTAAQSVYFNVPKQRLSVL